MISSCFITLCYSLLLGTTLASSDQTIHVERTNKSTHKEALQVLEILGCQAAVHKATGSKASFILEPLLCWKAGMEQLVCPGFDYLRSRHFLRVPVLLTDPAVPDRAKMLLHKLYPTSLQFMDVGTIGFRLIKTDQQVEIELEEQLGSSDGRKYLMLRVYCTTSEHCLDIKQGISTQPSLFFEKLRLSLSAGANASGLRQATRSVSAGSFVCQSAKRPAQGDSREVRETTGSKLPTDSTASNQTRVFEVEGQLYFLVQQRSSGAVSFQRSWAEFENGFGVLNGDYWMGLRLLHSLTKQNRVLRVELVRFRGSTFHQDFFQAEYNDFKVGPPPLFTLSYSALNRARSSVHGDALAESRGRGFSTMDRDNDGWSDSCSRLKGGSGGWWFTTCGATNLNGAFYGSNARNEGGIRWAYLDSMSQDSRMDNLKHVRILLRV